MSFLKFNLKTTIKNKFNVIPLIIAIVIIGVCLFFNNRNNTYTGLRAMRISSINVVKEHNKELLEKKETASNEEKEMIESTIKFNMARMKENEDIVSNIDNNEWPEVYSKLIYLTNQDIENYDNSNINNSIELKRAIKRDLLYYQYLSDNNLVYQDPNFPTKGVSFLLWMLKNVFPVMVSVFVIFILTQSYSKMFYENINVYSLFPYTKGKNVTLILCTSSLVSLGVIFIISMFSLIPSALIFGFGPLKYPILSYSGTETLYFQKMSDIYLKAFVLFILSILFCTLVTYLINYLFRNQLTSLFVTLLVIIAPLMLLNVVQPLQSIAHILPTTYLNSVSVIVGEVGYRLNNFQVNYNSGILVSISGILTILIIIIIVQTKDLKVTR